MLKLNIKITGDTWWDLEYILDEIKKKIAQEYQSGHASGISGDYTFTVSGEEETTDEPTGEPSV